MGKVLIIKDADFSANGIPLGESIDIAANLTLKRGYNINGEASASNANARLATDPNVDLSSYIAQGYSMLIAKLSTTMANYHNQCIRVTNAAGTQHITPSSTYTAEELTVPLTSELPYFRLSLKKLSGDYNSATYTADAFGEVLLVRF